MEAEERIDLKTFAKEARCSKRTQHCRGSSKEMKHNNSTQVTRSHHHDHHGGCGVQVLKPRISKLEHLEAKMASIEVSLSNALEQQGATPLRITRVGSGNKVVAVGNEVSCNNMNVANERLQKFAEEIEKLRIRLQEKDAIIGALREQMSQPLTTTNEVDDNQVQLPNELQVTDGRLTGTDGKLSKEAHVKECRLQQLQDLVNNKISTAKDIRNKLENLVVNDLDSRIHQAELECLLEREEMDILNFQQEQVDLRDAPLLQGSELCTESGVEQMPTAEPVTVYSIVSCSQCSNVVAVEIPYDVQSPCFYATAHHSGKGLFVQWAKDTTKMKKGDRLLEVNGQIVAGCSKDKFLDVLRSSSNARSPLRVVILRDTPMLPIRKVNKEIESLQEEMSYIINKLDTKIKENRELHLGIQKLQKECEQYAEEGQRLKHRNLYLEEQVADLTRARQFLSDIPAKNAFVGSCANLPWQSVGSRTASDGRATPSIAQSATVNKVTPVDAVRVQTCTSSRRSDHHILQVPVPFVTDLSVGQSIPRSNINETAARTSVYTNVPHPYILGRASYRSINYQTANGCWPHRAVSTDSDSGNYSGDSMDDAGNNSWHEDVSCLAPYDVDHEYVNLIQKHMRETVAFGTLSTSKVPFQLKDCNRNVIGAKVAAGSGTCKAATECCAVSQSGESRLLQDSSCVNSRVHARASLAELLDGSGASVQFQKSLHAYTPLTTNANRISHSCSELENEEWC